MDDDEYEHFDMFSGGKLCHEKNRILKIKIWETFLNSKNWVIIVSIFLLMVISLGIIVSSHHQLSPPDIYQECLVFRFLCEEQGYLQTDLRLKFRSQDWPFNLILLESGI